MMSKAARSFRLFVQLDILLERLRALPEGVTSVPLQGLKQAIVLRVNDLNHLPTVEISAPPPPLSLPFKALTH